METENVLPLSHYLERFTFETLRYKLIYKMHLPEIYREDFDKLYPVAPITLTRQEHIDHTGKRHPRCYILERKPLQTVEERKKKQLRAIKPWNPREENSLTFQKRYYSKMSDDDKVKAYEKAFKAIMTLNTVLDEEEKYRELPSDLKMTRLVGSRLDPYGSEDESENEE